MPDGSLRISTKIDNSKIDRDIMELENKIKKLQRNNAKNSLEQESIQDEINKYDELCLKADEYHHKIKQLNIEKEAIFKANPELAVSVDNPQYANIKNQIAEIKQKYEETTQEIDKQAPKIEKIRLKLQDVKAKQTENNTKIAEYNRQLQESQKRQFDLNYSTQGIGKSINKGITKILKYGMALFSIRSIYGLLSNAMNSWLNGSSTGAKQLRSDIDYMKNAIGGALSPILKYIVNLLYQALGFTGALIKAFTGVDIFAGSVADYMASTTSSANATNKELKKQLTSFDKINKLNDNDTGKSGADGETMLPSQDLSSVMNKYTEQAEKLKEIFFDIKDYVIAIGLAIAGWEIGKILGLTGKQKLGLAIGLASMPFYIDGIAGIMKGELNAENFMKIFASSAGLGISAGMLTGNWKLGLIIAIGAMSFAGGLSIGEKIKEYCPDSIDWYIKQVNLDWDNDSLIEKVGKTLIIGLGTIGDAVIKAINDWFGIDLHTEFDIWYRNLIEYIATMLENIPFVGESWAKGFREAFEEKDVSGNMTDAVVDATTSAIMGGRGSIEECAGETGESSGEEYTKAFQNTIKSSEQDMKNSITETMENSTNDSTSHIQMNGDYIATTLTEKINDIVGNNQKREELKKSIESTIENATKNSTGSIEQDAENLALALTKEIDNTITDPNEQMQLKDAITGTINNAVEKSKFDATSNGFDLGKTTIKGVETGEQNQSNNLKNTTKQVVKSANTNVDTSDAWNIGKNIIKGITGGITGNSWSLFSSITSIASTLLSKFKGALGIHSPSREMASLAKFIPLGIAEGIDSTSDKAIGSMKDLVTDIEDTASNMDIQYNIPKIPKNAISYVPRQAISTNEIQRTIVGEDSNLLNKLLSNIQTSSNGNKTIAIQLIIDGEEFVRKTIQLNKDYNLATNGGGL